MAPNNTEKYLDYLDQKAPIAPANSQEELQAAEAIADVFEAHGLEAQVEEFVASNAARTVRAVLRILAFIGILLAHASTLPLSILGVVLTLFSVVVLLLDSTGHPILSHNTPPVRSQNVVAVHRATGSLVSKGKRPIVIVAHYDTKRCNPLRAQGFQGMLPALSVAAFYGLWVSAVCTLAQPIFALGNVRVVLWIVGIVALVPSVILGIAGVAEKFSSYSEGANDNKASVAAMLSILNAVRPNAHDLDGLYSPQTTEADAEDLASQANTSQDAYAADKNRGAASSYRGSATRSSRPTYHLEKVEGVRHGKDMLLQLGVLPPECEIEYVRPQMVPDVPVAAQPVAPADSAAVEQSPVVAESAVSEEPVVSDEPVAPVAAYEDSQVMETVPEAPYAQVDSTAQPEMPIPAANPFVEEETTQPSDAIADAGAAANNAAPETPVVSVAETQPLAEFEPAIPAESVEQAPILSQPETNVQSESEVEMPLAEFETEPHAEQAETEPTAEPSTDSEATPASEEIHASEATPAPEPEAEPEADVLIAHVEQLPIEAVETAGVDPIHTEADLSAELPVISSVDGAVTHPKVTRPEQGSFLAKFKSLLGIESDPSIVDQVARMVPAESDLENELDEWLMSDTPRAKSARAEKNKVTETTPEHVDEAVSSEVESEDGDTSVTAEVNAAVETVASNQDDATPELDDASVEITRPLNIPSLDDEPTETQAVSAEHDVVDFPASKNPEVTAQFKPITDDMLPAIDLISPETSDQFDTVPEAAFANLEPLAQTDADSGQPESLENGASDSIAEDEIANSPVEDSVKAPEEYDVPQADFESISAPADVQQQDDFAAEKSEALDNQTDEKVQEAPAPSAPVATFERIEDVELSESVEEPTQGVELVPEDMTSEAGPSVEAEPEAEPAEISQGDSEQPEAFFEPVPTWMKSLMHEGTATQSSTPAVPTSAVDGAEQEEHPQVESGEPMTQLDVEEAPATLPNADFVTISEREEGTSLEEESEAINSDSTPEVEELTTQESEPEDSELAVPEFVSTPEDVDTTEDKIIPDAVFEVLPTETDADEDTSAANEEPLARSMPNSYDGETDEGAMYITSEFPIITPEQIEQEIEGDQEADENSQAGTFNAAPATASEITAQFTVIEGALSDEEATRSTPAEKNLELPSVYDDSAITKPFSVVTEKNEDQHSSPQQFADSKDGNPESTPEAVFEPLDSDHTGVAHLKGDGDESGLAAMGTEDPDATTADPTPQMPPLPNDPEWGTSSFEPGQPNVARRAALFDLPDPTSKEVDPLDEQDPDVTAPTPRTQMAKLPALDGYKQREEHQPKHRAPRKAKKHVPTKRLDQPGSSAKTAKDNAERKRKRHMFGKKTKQDEGSLSQWLGVEDDFDARRDGREIGSWDNFDDKPKWKGGAAVNESYRIMDINLDGGAPDAQDLRDAIVSMGDEELLSHDIWFVALGASELDHAGMEAFLEEHRKSIRGSFVINLDSIGAGDLTLLAQEGLHGKRRADRRLVRLLMGIAHDLNIPLPTKRYTWAETDVTQAMRSSLRSVTLMGTNHAAVPAQSGTKEDVFETVNHQQVQDVVRLVCELIRRS